MNQQISAFPGRVHMLDFPYGDEIGGLLPDVLPGIHVLPLPTGMKVGPVNAVIIREDAGPFAGGWTIIDPGPDNDAARDAWMRLSGDLLAGRPVRRVLVTHAHSDHIGLAGWFHRRDGAELWTSAASWHGAHQTQTRPVEIRRAETERFLRRCGYRRSMIDAYRDHAPARRVIADPLPTQFRPLQEGETIAIGDRDWMLAFGQGHAADHVILRDRDGEIVVTGDQILPGISPDTGVSPSEPDGDPLGAWQQSCVSLGKLLDDNMLTIPGHGAPFRGARRRLGAIRQAQDRGLERLSAFVSGPRTTVECFEAFYRRTLDPGMDTVALMLTYACLNRLRFHQRVLSFMRPDGVVLWTAKGRDTQ